MHECNPPSIVNMRIPDNRAIHAPSLIMACVWLVLISQAARGAPGCRAPPTDPSA